MNKKKLLINLGKRIRSLRQEKGISQEELAELAKVDRTYIGGIERGERNVSILSIEKICIALEIKIPDLFIEL